MAAKYHGGGPRSRNGGLPRPADARGIGGRDHAANPRSSALGAFQFLGSTFIAVVRRDFPEQVARCSDADILALTNGPFACQVAAAYARDNMAYLFSRGLDAGDGALRPAFLVGPAAAARLLEARREVPLSAFLSTAAITAKPFMAGMRVSDLIAGALRDVGATLEQRTAAPPVLRWRHWPYRQLHGAPMPGFAPSTPRSTAVARAVSA